MIIKSHCISEEEYESRLKEIKERNESKLRKQKLKEEKEKHSFKFKLPSTSKIVLLVVFLMCLEIIIFSEYAMIALGDASAMYTLIGVPVTLIPIVISYYNKSKAENTKNGIVYDSAMHKLDCDN